MGRGQQSIERLGPGLGGAVGEEGLQIGVGRRQASEVQRGAAQQGRLGRRTIRREALGGHRPGEVGVDSIAAGGRGGHGRFHRNLEGPVALVFGSLLDPTFHQRDLILAEHLVELGRGHVVVRIVGPEALHHLAGLRPARDDSRIAGFAALERRLGRIKTQAAFDLLLVRPVAGEAGVGEDRPDVAVEMHLLRGGGERHEKAGGGKAETVEAHGVRTLT